MDIYDMQVKSRNEGVLAQIVENGRKVQITRMATYTYEIDMTDVYGVLGEPDISVQMLISLEEGESGIRYNRDVLDMSTIEDDVVISVEVL